MTKKTKVLIGDDSIEQGINWASLLKAKGMFAITRPRNGKVILDAIKADQPDVVIIEAKMPEYDAVSLMATLKEQLDKLPIFIVISNYDSAQIEREVMNAGAKYYMVKPFEAKTLVDRVENTVASQTITMKNFSYTAHEEVIDDLEYVVTDVIHQIGIPAHIKGFHYLRCAIMLCVEKVEMLDSITKHLYPEVAQRYSTTASRVERAIRHAIEIAWDRGDIEILNSYFGYTIDTARGKPTNSEFIALISDKIRLRFKNRSYTL